jgi:hypothetical protein
VVDIMSGVVWEVLPDKQPKRVALNLP